MGALVSRAAADALTDEDVAALALGLADSGQRLALEPCAADLASTGGPSSLSTLLCPLHLSATGYMIPKLGVRGRPAGGVDVLETIPGYRAALDLDEVRRGLRQAGYVHILADGRWAPLDAALFAYRQRHGHQGIPALVIASILAKKLAAGVTGAGLEVRVAPHGNFGGDLPTARANARRYNTVASLLDLKPVCALTDGSRPYQPYIGRGEALLAVALVLSGRASGWLAEHHDLCMRMSRRVAQTIGVTAHADPSDQESLVSAHAEMLEVHGAGLAAFERRVEEIRCAPREDVPAPHDGIISYDLDRLRHLLVARQRQEEDGTFAADPAGVILAAATGASVVKGQPVMSVRVPVGEAALARELAATAHVAADADDPRMGSPAATLEVI